MSRFVRLYGRHPGHLVAMLFTYAVATYAVFALFQNPKPWTVLLWLGGAIVAHDFIFLPLYTAAYRIAWRMGGVERDRRRRVLALQHLAAPAMVSLLLLLMWLPLILRLSAANYRPTTGMMQDAYLWRWLAVTSALFALSALLFAVRGRGRAGG